MQTETTTQLGIEGMTCAACVTRVERALRRVPGVEDASVNLATETAQVRWAQGVGDEIQLRRAVRAAGYVARETATLPDAGSTWQGVGPVVLGLLLCAPLILPMLGDVLGRHWMLTPLWQFLLATPVQFGLGARFYRGTWHAITSGSAGMDVLVALGTTAGWALSTWLWWRASPGEPVSLYFEASAVVITLVLLGKWLETRAKVQTTAAIRSLQALRPERAHLITALGEDDVPVAELMVNDRLSVRPGERVPADGRVLEGRTQVDESMLTGESVPVVKQAGALVTGGSVNGDGRVVIQVTAVGAESVLARIIRWVEDAQAAKAPIQRLVDQVSAVFVPVVMVLSVLTGLAWAGLGADLPTALIHAVAVMVIACPCALGLATPVAIMAGTGVAAQRGILIRDAQALEIAHRVNTVAFDKTGTLTQGHPQLTHYQPFTSEPTPNDGLMLAASLLSGSEHPLARAVIQHARGQGLVLQTANAVEAVAGRGTQGLVSGRRLVMGSLSWIQSLYQPEEALRMNDNPHAEGDTLENLNATTPLEWVAAADQAMSQGYTVSLLAEQQPDSLKVRALFAFEDAPKPEALQALQALRERGLQVLMISGDNLGAARSMGRRLGLQDHEVLAPVLPADKAAQVAHLRAQGRVVAFVGDGINDAPALAAADVGMAMANPGGGTEVAMNTAGITLMRGDVRLVADALDVSDRTVRKIRQNLFWAFAYNTAGIPLAALGYLSPLVAGAAMALSSVSVMANALLLRRWRGSSSATP
jgi:Cu+-exporting ATPase